MDDDVFFSDSSRPGSPLRMDHYEDDFELDLNATATPNDSSKKASSPGELDHSTKTGVDVNAPSDIPRLRSVHSTAGYRDGIAVAKNEYIQTGFDEGYALGAVLGLRIGWVLGALEGLWIGLEKSADKKKKKKEAGQTRTTRAVGLVSGKEDEELGLVRNNTTVGDHGKKSGSKEEGEEEEEDVAKKMQRLFEQAGEELGTENVFGKAYFGPDGIWLFNVHAGAHGGVNLRTHSDGTDSTNKAQGDGESEYTFEDVAASHPLVKKWTNTVVAETQKWGVALDVFEGEEYEARRLPEDVVAVNGS